ncbi:MAG TPA: beta-ketoacyl-ACP synthase III [Gaiellaceae bacterium]
MIGACSGRPVSITGLGCYVPERVLANEELSKLVDTNDEWIQTRTGIKERRIAAPEEATSDLCLPAARAALADAAVAGAEVDLIIVATITPDMLFPATATILADHLGAVNAAAYDLSAGCTGFVYALTQGYGAIAAGLARRVLVIGADTLSRVVDWEDRSTCILFGDGAGAVVLEQVEQGGFHAFELGADGAGGMELFVPAGGSRRPVSAETVAAREHYLKMNGREVYKFATRVLPSSAKAVLEASGKSIWDIDLYVPHQANLRIIEHAARKLGIEEERVFVNVDRYGNTSSASIPLALCEARSEGRLTNGKLVLMTGMGAGLTWGSSVITWTGGSKDE